MLPDVEAVPVADELCWLCGGATHGEGQPLKARLKETFTDVDLAKAPWSSSFCRGCAFCLTWQVLATNGYLVSDGGLRFVARSEWRDLLLVSPPKRYLACIPTSGKKWLHYKGRIVTSGRWGVQFEDVWVDVPDSFPQVVAIVERLYAGGFTKAEIRDGTYQPHRIQAYGIREWEADEQAVGLHRGSRAFELAVFVARKEEG